MPPGPSGPHSGSMGGPGHFGASGWVLKFQCHQSNPTNHRTGLSEPPKVSQMRSKKLFESIKFMHKVKTVKYHENHYIYYVFELTNAIRPRQHLYV